MSVSGTLYTEKATLMEHFEKWTIYACGLMKHLIYNQLATNCQTRSLYCTVYWGESISPSSLLMFLPVSLSLSVSYTHLHTHTRTHSLTHSLGKRIFVYKDCWNHDDRPSGNGCQLGVRISADKGIFGSFQSFLYYSRYFIIWLWDPIWSCQGSG